MLCLRSFTSREGGILSVGHKDDGDHARLVPAESTYLSGNTRMVGSRGANVDEDRLGRPCPEQIRADRRASRDFVVVPGGVLAFNAISPSSVG